MTIGTLLGFMCIAFGLQQCSADLAGLTSTCQNETITEGETGHMPFSINPKIPIHDDPRGVIFIKQYQATGNIIRCRRQYNGQHVGCKVSDHRFQSDGLIDHTISLRVPNVMWSLQGHYELHVVANGTFHPTTSCYLAVHNKTGLNPEDKETINVVSIVVPIVICLLSLFCALVIANKLCIRKHQIRQCCRRGSTEKLKSTTLLGGDRDTKSAHLLPGLDDSGKGLRETTTSACDVPNSPENLIRSEESGVNPTERAASHVDPDTHQIGHANENVDAVTIETEAPHLNSQMEDERREEPTETNGLRQYDQEPSVIKHAKKEDERREEPTETNGLRQYDQEPSVIKHAKKISNNWDVPSTTARFNELGKLRKSKKREQNKVASPGAGTSQSVLKGGFGTCGPAPVRS